MNISLNGRYILEPYMSDHQIKATQGAGFSMIQQKISLVGLKVLVDVLGKSMDVYFNGPQIQPGLNPIVVKKGATAWIKEEVLYTQPWAKNLYTCSAIEGKFIIVDPSFVEFVTYEIAGEASS
jgi:hypothetical protein